MLELPARGAPNPAASGSHLPLPGVSAAALAAALDEVGQGLLIVDVPGGRLRHANRQALTECSCHGLLGVEDGLVRATDAADQRLLQQALSASLQGRRGLVSLRGGGGHPAGAPGGSAAANLPEEAPEAASTPPPRRTPSLVLAVVPLQPAAGVPQALIVFGRRQMADTLAVGYFARLNGLTPTEESVLLALCRGAKPTEIAVAQGVAISTVRTHVNAIRLKTGAGSIREVTQQVAMLPPLAPALRDGMATPLGER